MAEVDYKRALRRTTLMTNLSNVVGVVVVLAFLLLLLPGKSGGRGLASDEVNLITAAVFLPLAFFIGIGWSSRRAAKTAAWLEAGRKPTREDVIRLLRAPLFGFALSASIWAGGALIFGVVNATASLLGGVVMAIPIAMGGLTTAALTSLAAERALRPIMSVALAHSPPIRAGGPGVGRRMTDAWLLGTGLPVAGAALVLIGAMAGVFPDDGLRAAVLLLVLALSIGLWMIYVTARTIAEPVAAIGAALARVEQGDFEAHIKIEDGTEVGRLQAGFNQMTAGLAERERIREAFGTYVDPDVAERVLREGTMLEGEEVEISVLFLDVRGFTSYVERSSARDVVEVLNRLFELIVPIIRRHEGHVNKFLGDGLLALFGAPVRLDDHADRALRAGIEIATAVKEEFGEQLQIGIGINTGLVVAGNVGGAGRLEFSVIGDAVNVAARVEAATRVTGDTILITERTRERLTGAVPELVERPAQPLKGKSEPVAVFAVSLFSKE